MKTDTELDQLTRRMIQDLGVVHPNKEFEEQFMQIIQSEKALTKNKPPLLSVYFWIGVALILTLFVLSAINTKGALFVDLQNTMILMQIIPNHLTDLLLTFQFSLISQYAIVFFLVFVVIQTFLINRLVQKTSN